MVIRVENGVQNGKRIDCEECANKPVEAFDPHILRIHQAALLIIQLELQSVQLLKRDMNPRIQDGSCDEMIFFFALKFNPHLAWWQTRGTMAVIHFQVAKNQIAVSSLYEAFLLVHRYTSPVFIPQFFQHFAISLAVVWMQFIPQWEKRFAFGGHASWEKQFECHSKWSLFISLKAMQKRLFYQCKRYMRNARISLIVLPNTFRCCSTYLNKLPVYQFGFVQLMSLHC